MINLACDRNYPPLAFVEDWVGEIAARAESVQVITNRFGEFHAAENVTVRTLGGEVNAPDLLRLWRLWSFTFDAIVRHGCSVCFAHMTPKFAALVSPICRITRTPLVLWYAHTQVSPWLRAAVTMSDACVTPASTTLRIQTPKRHFIGHGVSVQRMTRRPPSTGSGNLTVMHIGRIAAVKRLEVVIEAFGLLPEDVRRNLQLRLIGDPLTEADVIYKAHLQNLVQSYGVQNCVRFEPAVPFQEVGRMFQQADIAFNGAPAVDKAALEAMAVGLPCIVMNSGFVEAMGEDIRPLFASDQAPSTVADILVRLATMPAGERDGLSDRLRAIVVERHSVRALIGRVFEVFNGLTSRRTATAR